MKKIIASLVLMGSAISMNAAVNVSRIEPTDWYVGMKDASLQLMVMALHKAGIRVIFDAVYNHTFDINGSNFQRTYPDYYYRKTKDGKYSDGSGCGNETASEKPLMRQFMLESVKYWIDEYHIDGFRFDLMGVHDIETMQAIREMVNRIDPSSLIFRSQPFWFIKPVL
jgi:pullulanase